MKSLIIDPAVLRYLEAFRNDFVALNESSRLVEFYGQKIVVQPDVFPSDSSYSFSTQSILQSVLADHEQRHLLEVNSICDVGTGCGVFLCVLGRFFESARLVGLDIDPLARKNAAINLMNLRRANYSLLLSDLFEATEEKFDLVVTSLPFVCDFRYGNEINLRTLSQFWDQIESRLSRRGRLYINWASWANFSLFESLANETSLTPLRIDLYPHVVQEFSWKTYVFGR